MPFIQQIFGRFWPIVKADEDEVVDHQKILREKCAATDKCVKLQEILNQCNDRVNSRTKTEEICLEELIDYVQCVDHCAAKDLFKKLK